MKPPVRWFPAAVRLVPCRPSALLTDSDQENQLENFRIRYDSAQITEI